MTNLWPLIGFLCLICIAVLYIKGKEDAETFDGELRYVITRIRNCPVNSESYRTFLYDFRRLSNMPGKNREHLSVAWSEFKVRFKEYFK